MRLNTLNKTWLFLQPIWRFTKTHASPYIISFHRYILSRSTR